MAGGTRWLVPFRDEVVTSAVERLQSSLREHRIDIDSYLVLPRANCLSSTAGEEKKVWKSAGSEPATEKRGRSDMEAKRREKRS